MTILKHTAKTVKVISVIIAVAYLVMFCILALYRIAYPFELECCEGGLLEHVGRILAGKQLYVKPSLEFTSFVYTPLYYYAGALCAKCIGFGFTPLRLVSFFSTIGIVALIFRFVTRQTANTYAGIMAACLYLACFKPLGGWFHVAKMDSLMLVLLLSGAYCVRFGTSIKYYVFAGVLFALSYLSKQSALIMCVPLICFVLFVNKRYFFVLLGSFVAVMAGLGFLFEYMNDGWFSYYTFYLPRQHDVSLSTDIVWKFWIDDICAPLPVAFAASIMYMGVRVFRKHFERDVLFYLFLIASMLGGAYMSRIDGSARHALFSAYACLSIVFGMALSDALDYANRIEHKQRVIKIAVYALCLVQFGLLAYNPVDQIPTAADIAAGNTIVEIIKNTDGDVFIPAHNYLNLRAGKKGHAHWFAMGEIFGLFGGGPKKGAQRLSDEISQALSEQRFEIIILDTHFLEEIETQYMRYRKIFRDPDVFMPKAGIQIRPEFIYVRRKQR